MKRIPLRLPALLFLVLACSCNAGSKPSPADTTPPATIQDLAVTRVAGRRVTFTWTAPSHNGAEGRASRYEARYSGIRLTEEGWTSATVVVASPVPKAAGMAESLRVEGLSIGTWYFAVKAADGVPNWSTISNVVSATVTADSAPPRLVTDLAVSSVSGRSVTIGWSAPGNNGGIGRAAEYDLRYALTQMSEGSWSAATRVQGVFAPDSAGTAESFKVTGLESGRTYYFALKTANEMATWSGMSNVVSATTASLQRLTTSPTGVVGAQMPAWSPDGERIAFMADWGERNHHQVYLVGATGGSPTRLREGPEHDTAPSWSPDSRRIAFVSSGGGAQDGLRVMDASPGAASVRLTDPGLHVRSSTWSPDGTRIAYDFDTTTDPLTPSMAICIIPSAGGTPGPLVVHPSLNYDPSWSPDGTQIAFVSKRSGNADIWVIPVNGGEPVQLTSVPGWELYPAWSPDGRRIAFSSDRTGNAEIWVMSADGTNPVQLTDNSALINTHPTWSPSGDRIAFASRPSNNAPCDIWVLYLE